jgi:hypothetical protein
MLREELLLESSASNKPLGLAYELSTALHIHDNSSARLNSDNHYRMMIDSKRELLKKTLEKLTDAQQKKVTEGGHASGSSYLQQLRDSGVDTEKDIHEVHHTPVGIGHILGQDVDQRENPHDVMVRFKGPHKAGYGPNKDLHGVSLKLTSGTVSNNGVGQFDNLGGIGTKVTDIWDKARRSVKPTDSDEKINTVYKKTQAAVAKHHADAFNGSNIRTQKNHLRYLMRARPDMPYAYNVAETGKSMMIHDHPAVKAMEKAKSLRAENKNGITHIYDQDNNHLLSVEHRRTHSGDERNPLGKSIQANAKFGKYKG